MVTTRPRRVARGTERIDTAAGVRLATTKERWEHIARLLPDRERKVIREALVLSGSAYYQSVESAANPEERRARLDAADVISTAASELSP